MKQILTNLTKYSIYCMFITNFYMSVDYQNFHRSLKFSRPNRRNWFESFPLILQLSVWQSDIHISTTSIWIPLKFSITDEYIRYRLYCSNTQPIPQHPKRLFTNDWIVAYTGISMSTLNKFTRLFEGVAGIFH